MSRRSAYYSRAGSYSRSYRAEVAETEGRCPMSRAKVAVAKRLGCTQVVAQAALKLLHDGEWHHVGKFACQVEYYDPTDWRLGGVISHIYAVGGLNRWRSRREELRAARTINQPRSRFVITSWGAYRVDLWRRYRDGAAFVLERPAEASLRLHSWDVLRETVMPIGGGYVGLIECALLIGWTLDQAVIAAVSAGYTPAFIREWLAERNPAA